MLLCILGGVVCRKLYAIGGVNYILNGVPLFVHTYCTFFFLLFFPEEAQVLAEAFYDSRASTAERHAVSAFPLFQARDVVEVSTQEQPTPGVIRIVFLVNVSLRENEIESELKQASLYIRVIECRRPFRRCVAK